MKNQDALLRLEEAAAANEELSADLDAAATKMADKLAWDTPGIANIDLPHGYQYITLDMYAPLGIRRTKAFILKDGYILNLSDRSCGRYATAEEQTTLDKLGIAYYEDDMHIFFQAPPAAIYLRFARDIASGLLLEITNLLLKENSEIADATRILTDGVQD